jgi:hypothetical protein
VPDPLDDVARFQPDDDSALVAAAFACPMCLRRPDLVKVSVDRPASSADCSCDICEIRWTVSLGGLQCLRMRVAPPRELVRVVLITIA